MSEFFTRKEALELVGKRAVIKTAFPSLQLREGVVGRITEAIPRSAPNQEEYLVAIEWDALLRSDRFTKPEMDHLSVG
jgi:hypothetical protein